LLIREGPDLVRPPLSIVYRCQADAVGRKTEEGFLIYKEAELDIDPEAGGTDLCPFDCECCKSRCPSSGKGCIEIMLTGQASNHHGRPDHIRPFLARLL
jgi:hypothetical protein